eukprot:822951-Prymnesium_polylepis.1
MAWYTMAPRASEAMPLTLAGNVVRCAPGRGGGLMLWQRHARGRVGRGAHTAREHRVLADIVRTMLRQACLPSLGLLRGAMGETSPRSGA